LAELGGPRDNNRFHLVHVVNNFNFLFNTMSIAPLPLSLYRTVHLPQGLAVFSDAVFLVMEPTNIANKNTLNAHKSMLQLASACGSTNGDMEDFYC
jgi:hypothetical protein